MIQGPVVGVAPGKIILFGEHAVVYGRPAIAVPVQQVQAQVTLKPARPGRGLWIEAVDLGWAAPLEQLGQEDALATMTRLTLAHLEVSAPDAWLTVRSFIPVASGLGSGAAVSAALVRGLANFLDRSLSREVISQLVYEVEKLHHGTPSGIDNTVVVYGMPVYFVRGQAPQTFDVGAALHLVIGDTGVSSATRVAVGDVRHAWEKDRERYERLFEQVGEVTWQARDLIQSGQDKERLGRLMNLNHLLLRRMGVSSPELERLVDAARAAGALGAKLSGAGQGGNMIALVEPTRCGMVADALREAGATRVIETVLR